MSIWSFDPTFMSELPAEANNLSTRNKSAWNALYRDTDGSVWGTTPVPFVEEFLDTLRSELNDSSLLLDAAAGDGRHVPILLAMPGTVYACDSSEHALEKILPGNPDVQRVFCDLASTPFGNDTFDFISIVDTIETLPSPDSILVELHRILKPGGRLLCNIPGTEDGIASVAMEPVQESGGESYLYRDTYFYRFYGELEALEMLTRCGFEVLRNDMRSWEEAAHPGFRDYRHGHTSRVFLLRKLSRSGAPVASD